jgi:hypothetical protein
MIEHIWTVLCSRAILDVDSKNVSIQNVIEQINIIPNRKADRPLRVDFDIVSLWVRSEVDVPERAKARLRLVDPSGTVFHAATFEVDLSDCERARTKLRFRDLPNTFEGRYRFTMELSDQGSEKWRTVASVPLSVVVASVHSSEMDITAHVDALSQSAATAEAGSAD